MECSLFHAQILEAEMFARFFQASIVALALTISNQANAAPLAYGTYYDETVQGCVNGTSCRVNFSQLPADKLLMVGKINCQIVSGQPIESASFLISATSGGGPLQRQAPIAVTPSQLIGGSYFTNFREDTHFLVGQGRFPYVSVNASASTGYFSTCTLVGDLVTPIQ
jgi:hypothetical protein